MYGFGGKSRGFWQDMAIRKQPSARRKSSSDKKAWEDDVLREVYATRDAWAAEYDHDLDRIYEDLKRREAGSRLRRAGTRPLTSA